MRILITGAAGMLGRDVADAARAAGHEAVALARPDLDVTDAAAVRAAVARARPDAVVNCAAWTDVDGAEAHEEEATAVNGQGAANVAEAGVHTVHVSTDYVFDGTASEPYPEDAPTNPMSAYGRSKLEGEGPVLAHGGAVVRASWLFGAHGPNFVATMLRLAGERDELTVVDDQVGSPTYTGHLAAALVTVTEQRLGGVLHVAGGGACSWYDLAVAAFEETGATVTVHRGATADLGRPAPRPACSVLGVTRPDTPRLPPWREGLREYLAS
jgi:dTDP-4-dehydrorhamnose reductase